MRSNIPRTWEENSADSRDGGAARSGAASVIALTQPRLLLLPFLLDLPGIGRRRRVDVSGSVDGADLERVLLALDLERLGRVAGREVGLVELALEARARLVGGELELRLPPLGLLLRAIDDRRLRRVGVGVLVGADVHRRALDARGTVEVDRREAAVVDSRVDRRRAERLAEVAVLGVGERRRAGLVRRGPGLLGARAGRPAGGRGVEVGVIELDRRQARGVCVGEQVHESAAGDHVPALVTD